MLLLLSLLLLLLLSLLLLLLLLSLLLPLLLQLSLVLVLRWCSVWQMLYSCSVTGQSCSGRILVFSRFSL